MSFNQGNVPELDSRIKSDIESTIRSSKIFILSKKKCGACVQAKALLNKLASKKGFTPEVFDLDNYPTRMVLAIVKWLSAKTRIKTVPQIWIHGKFVGGNDDVQRLYLEGRLVSMIAKKATRGKVLEGRSFRTKDLAPSFGVSATQKVQVPRQSVTKSENLNFEAGRTLLSYRSSTYTVDDNKWDTPLHNSQLRKFEPRRISFTYAGQRVKSQLHNSQFQKFEQRRNSFGAAGQRAKSFSYAGNVKPTTNMSGSRKNWVPPTKRSTSLRAKETNIGQAKVSFDVIRNEQRATVQYRGRSRTHKGSKGVLVSRLV